MRRRDPPVAELSRGWFARPTTQVARDLVGCILVVDSGSPDAVVARIVETEAYLGLADPASHAFRGPTRRCAVMFGPPAHLYVYFTYGMHHCANVVTEIDGVAGAVLLRAAAVQGGFETVASRRGVGIATAAMLRGPGNLCRGLGITRADDGVDLLDRSSRVRIQRRQGRPPIVVSTRVGVRLAADRLLRFTWRGDPAVSSPLPRAPAGGPPTRGKRKGPAEPAPQ
jgi:DNA-3-methyladenine glycosylase